MTLKNLKKTYKLKFSTSNLANLVYIKGLFFSFLSDIKKGDIMLPKKKKRFTLIKSPHVNKKSKEHFQIIKYRRLYIVNFSEIQLNELLQKITTDVEVTIKCNN
jgi:ribosomal protein S10